ncbi:CaiB/BaiF CoA transferase family protein [Aeromicrobium sp. CF4.19]|uniref:CaiB/BaiF CoA transferase family protein n=1 Tax=Aeromicrobium sp. CF4.19 TaxID=3373082 RepID=UPI003EE4774F
MTDLPLDGLTVVAVEQAVAAPLATRNLADLGARVVKIERVGDGDLARGYDHVVHGTGAHFVWLNRGKESVALDLKAPAALDALHSLVAGADVFVQNLAPGAADRLGLGPDRLRAEHPELVVAGISGYGAGGAMEHRKAYDMLIQAEAGLISVTGTTDEPVKTGIPTADIAAGMYLSQAVVAALLRRFRTGEGATIDVSMFEATVEWLGHALYTQMSTGSQPARMGVGHSAIAPYNTYPTADGEMLIGVQSDSGWRTLTEVLDVPQAASDPRFATNVDRVAHREECDALVAGRTRTWSTVELDRKLAAAGIPAAQLRGMDHVLTHPQLRERDRWRSVGTEFARVDALLPPATFADVEAPMGDVPALGQHTHAALVGIGLDPAAVDGLITTGAAGQAAAHAPAARV